MTVCPRIAACPPCCSPSWGRPLLAAAVVCLASAAADVAHAQNDWQYPDPYFGIVEIEGTRRQPADRRPRVDSRPQPAPTASAPRRPRWAPRRHRAGPAVARGTP